MSATLFAKAMASTKFAKEYVRSRWPSALSRQPSCSSRSSSSARILSIGGTPPRHGMHCWSARLIGLPPGKFVVDEFPVVALLAFYGSEQGAREDELRRIPCWPGSGHRMKIEVAVRTYRGGAQQRWHRLSGNGSSS